MSLAHVLGRRSRHWLLRWPAFGNAARVGTLTTAAKIVAAIKIAVTARFFGAGDELDAFLTAFIVPALFGDTVAGAFTPSIVPGLIRVESQQGREPAHRLATSAAALGIAVMLGMGILLAAGSPWILPILGSSFPSAKLSLTVGLFIGLLLWLPFGALISVWRGVLNAHGQFALAALGPLGAPLASIVLLYAGAARWGVWVLVAGTAVGLAVECAMLAIAVHRLGYPIMPAWRLRWTPELAAVTRQCIPLIATAITVSASSVIDQAFAGALGSGAVSALGYGVKLSGVLLIVVAMGVATAVLPEFSQMAARNDWRQLRHATLTYAGVATAVIVPMALILMWFSEPLARFFFERGAFSPSDTQLVARVQRFALMEAPLAVLFAVGSRLATAISANRLLAHVGLAALVVNIVADWFFSRWWGVVGIALATAVVRSAAVVVLAVMLYRKQPLLFKKEA